MVGHSHRGAVVGRSHCGAVVGHLMHHPPRMLTATQAPAVLGDGDNNDKEDQVEMLRLSQPLKVNFGTPAVGGDPSSFEAPHQRQDASCGL